MNASEIDKCGGESLKETNIKIVRNGVWFAGVEDTDNGGWKKGKPCYVDGKESSY